MNLVLLLLGLIDQGLNKHIFVQLNENVFVLEGIDLKEE